MTIIRNQFNQSNIPLFIAFFAFISIGMPGGILNIAWVYMDDTFSVTIESLGIVLTAGTSGHLVASFLSGRFISKYGLSNALISASLLAGFGAIGFVLTPSWELLLFAALLAGIGGGFLDSSLNSFVSTRYSVGQLNWLHAFFGVGWAMGPILVTFWIDIAGRNWRWGYVVIAFLQVILLFLLILTRQNWTISEDSTDKRIQETQTSKDHPRLLETFMLPTVLISLLFFFLYGGAEVGVAQLSPILFVDGRNIPEATASLWVFLFLGSFTIGRMIFGTFANRFSTTTLMRTTFIFASVGAILLWANISALVTIISLILMGTAFAPMFPTLISDISKHVGKHHAPNAIGFQIGFAGLGIAALPGLAGVLADSIDLEIIGPFLTINIIVMFAVYEWMLWQERKVPQPTPVAATD